MAEVKKRVTQGEQYSAEEKKVISWIGEVFKDYRKELKGGDMESLVRRTIGVAIQAREESLRGGVEEPRTVLARATARRHDVVLETILTWAAICIRDDMRKVGGWTGLWFEESSGAKS
jgi:hypothetical protein